MYFWRQWKIFFCGARARVWRFQNTKKNSRKREIGTRDTGVEEIEKMKKEERKHVQKHTHTDTQNTPRTITEGSVWFFQFESKMSAKAQCATYEWTQRKYCVVAGARAKIVQTWHSMASMLLSMFRNKKGEEIFRTNREHKGEREREREREREPIYAWTIFIKIAFSIEVWVWMQNTVTIKHSFFLHSFLFEKEKREGEKEREKTPRMLLDRLCVSFSFGIRKNGTHTVSLEVSNNHT